MFKELNLKKTCDIELSDKIVYKKLKDYVGETINPVGFIIHEKGKFGKSLSVILNSETAVNMPSWAVKTFENFSEEEVESFKNGNCLITDIEEIETANGVTTTFSFDDK